jgi:hypothetical protein
MSSLGAVELGEPVLSGLVPMLILAGILGALAIALGLIWTLRNSRRVQMQRLAMKIGWEFRHDRQERLAAAEQDFKDVPTVRRPEAMYTLTGWLRVGHRRLPAIMGDHDALEMPPGAYPRQGREGPFSYLIVQLPVPSTPELIVRREGVKDRLVTTVLPAQVDLESAEFNRRFFVRAGSKKFAFAVLHPRAMEFLMRSRPPMVEIRSGWMCLTNGSRRWKPAEFLAQVAWAEKFLALWPEYLFEALGGA